MTSMTFNVPTRTRAPHGAWIAAAAFARVLQLIAGARAARAARRASQRQEDDCASVRQYAYQIMGQDPRFASDLFAAADRAELEAQSRR